MLFNDKGQLVGVNSFGDEQVQGLNYAVSLNEFRSFIEDGKLGRFPVEMPKTQSGAVASASSRTGGGPQGTSSSDDNGDLKAERSQPYAGK